MSPDCCVALPHDAIGFLQSVIVVFPDHTHLLILVLFVSDSVWFRYVRN